MTHKQMKLADDAWGSAGWNGWNATHIYQIIETGGVLFVHKNTSYKQVCSLPLKLWVECISDAEHVSWYFTIDGCYVYDVANLEVQLVSIYALQVT